MLGKVVHFTLILKLTPHFFSQYNYVKHRYFASFPEVSVVRVAYKNPTQLIIAIQVQRLSVVIRIPDSETLI